MWQHVSMAVAALARMDTSPLAYAPVAYVNLAVEHLVASPGATESDIATHVLAAAGTAKGMLRRPEFGTQGGSMYGVGHGYAGASYPGGASTVRCYACKAPGHIAPECPDRAAVAAYLSKQQDGRSRRAGYSGPRGAQPIMAQPGYLPPPQAVYLSQQQMGLPPPPPGPQHFPQSHPSGPFGHPGVPPAGMLPALQWGSRGM